MTVHRDKVLVNETNRCTGFQFYWYYDSICFGQPFCPSSGVLSLHRHWYIFADLMTVCYQELDGTQFHPFFKDHMTVHRDRFLVNETNRRTGFQFYWYYDSTCFGQPFCPSSGVLSRTSALAHFMQF